MGKRSTICLAGFRWRSSGNGGTSNWQKHRKCFPVASASLH